MDFYLNFILRIFPIIYDSLPSAPGKRRSFGLGGVGCLGGGGGGGPATANKRSWLVLPRKPPKSRILNVIKKALCLSYTLLWVPSFHGLEFWQILFLEVITSCKIITDLLLQHPLPFHGQGLLLEIKLHVLHHLIQHSCEGPVHLNLGK